MRNAFVLALLTLAQVPAFSQHQISETRSTNTVMVATASADAEMAIKRFEVAPGLKVDLWAAEPLLANPVAFNFDERGRAYVCETFRLKAGVDDIRGIMDWLDEELASRSVEDRLNEMKRHLGDRFPTYSEHSERIRLIEDRDGDGKADHATVFAEGFNTPLDGIGAGVLARKGSVWYANIPNLWLLRDTNQDGVADVRQSLHYGFGVRVGFLGHDLHGVHFGPDGKIYFSIGDRGSNVKVAAGKNVGDPDSGCVFRSNPDGSDLEVFAYGLRNPQDLVFDQYGNLFTGDNNSDSGDQARWVYLVEGADNGWRVGYQFMENPYSRGPFNAEKLWYPQFEGQAAYIVPPITNIASGPSGVAYFPGTGLPSRFQNHFFLVDFRGGPANSGVHSFTLKPRGAGFELTGPEHFIWGVLATDVKFGVDGGAYVSDWVEGWDMTGKGRIYRVHDPAIDKDSGVVDTKRLLAQGLESRSLKDLAVLLAHRDLRVRQEAQFELADRGEQSIKTLASVARRHSNQLARLHGIWGLGQICSRDKDPAPRPEISSALDLLVQLCADDDAEVRAQCAKVLGDCRFLKAYPGLIKLLGDAQPRVQFFAAQSLGKLGRRDAVPALTTLLRQNADRDPFLRHATVLALAKLQDTDALVAAGKDESRSVRMGALLAMRRLQRSEIAMFLNDDDPAIVLEAARAINDEPINGAMQDLAALINKTWIIEAAPGAPPVEDEKLPPRNRRSRAGAAGRRSSPSEPLVRRVLNANFHFGTPDTAKALAAFAALTNSAENMRVEALQELADWPHPSGRDRVVGLWRPVAARREAGPAVEALNPALPGLLSAAAPEGVRIATLRTVVRLGITNTGDSLLGMVADKKASEEVRVEALKTMGALNDPRLEDALKVAQEDPSEDLRKAASPLLVQVKTSNPVVKLAAIIEHGTTGEKQAALAALVALRGNPAADELLLKWLGDLQAGNVPPELQFDVLEAAAQSSTPAIKEKLQDYEKAKPKEDPMAPYRETLFGGNGNEGKKIFFERPEAQCVRCHKVGGQGGDVGPDLSHVSAQKDRQYLLESIVQPNKQIVQGFESVMVALKNGDSFAGVLKSESPAELVLNSPDTGPITIKKSEIQSRRATLSPMPEGIGQILSKKDLRNLVEFLSGLK